MLLRAARILALLWLLGASLSAAADPQSDLAQCVTRIDRSPTGLTQLEKSCPGLQAALAQARVGTLIIASSGSRLDRYSLVQLQRLLQSGVERAPDVAALQPVLRGLKAPSPPHRTWLQRFWDWLVEHFTPKQMPQNSSAPWLTDLMRLAVRLKWLWTAIFWCTLIALPIAIGYIIWREVHAMGKRSNDERRSARGMTHGGLLPSRLAQLRAAPLSQRPALLFSLLIGQMVAAGRLPPDRSLTHREVARKAVLDDVGQRQLINSLARLSEQQLYAQIPGTAEGLDELLAQGEDLYTTGWAQLADTPK